MPRLALVIVVLSVVLSMARCASLQMGNEARSIDAPPNVVFETAAYTLRTAGFEIKTADQDSGWIETEQRGVHGAKTPWARRAEQVRVRIAPIGTDRARVRLFITFVDTASDGPRRSRPRRKKQGNVYDWDQTTVGRFLEGSEVYDEVLDAIEQRAEGEG